MTTELYRVHRPKRFEDVKGQDDAVRILTNLVEKKKVPHAILFSGSSGCGKTTLARILAKKLGCGKNDFAEINCADFRGIEMVRDIRQRMGLAPIGGKCRVWLIDEFQSATKDAQNGILKMLEDTPPHVYFMLATTDPQKLLPTIRTRCTEVKVSPLTPKVLTTLVETVTSKEGVQLEEEVVERLVEVSEGSARKALVLLHQIIRIESTEDQLNAIVSTDSKRQAIEIARALINPRAKWSDVSKILKGVEDEPETIRHLVLGYAKSVLLGGGKLTPRAYLIINAFRDNFYDSKHAGLCVACYEVCSPK